MAKKKQAKRRRRPLHKGEHNWINPSNFFYLVRFPDSAPDFTSDNTTQIEARVTNWLQGKGGESLDDWERHLEEVEVYKVYEEQALTFDVEPIPEVHVSD